VKFRVNIEPSRCKGCGICVTMCPMGVLVIGSKFNELGYRYPELVNVGRCIGCRLCEFYCPDFAIYVESIHQSRLIHPTD